jgi:proteasome activator subunit 4
MFILLANAMSYFSRERYAKEQWGCSISPEHKLTDSEVTEFVTIVKPVALLSMFSKSGFGVGPVLQSLATLRPELILPELIDRMYNALDSLTEPVRFYRSAEMITAVVLCQFARTAVFAFN